MLQGTDPHCLHSKDESEFSPIQPAEILFFHSNFFFLSALTFLQYDASKTQPAASTFRQLSRPGALTQKTSRNTGAGLLEREKNCGIGHQCLEQPRHWHSTLASRDPKLCPELKKTGVAVLVLLSLCRCNSGVSRSFFLQKSWHFPCPTPSPIAALFSLNRNFQQNTYTSRRMWECDLDCPILVIPTWNTSAQIIKAGFPTPAHHFMRVVYLLVISLHHTMWPHHRMWGSEDKRKCPWVAPEEV